MPKSKPLRIVIDTNLWISFLISKKFGGLDHLIFSKKVRILFSIELIEEIEATISKPKLRKYFSPGSLNEMLTSFDPFIDLVTVKSKVNVCRDPHDDFLLALAKDGKANYLVTGDKDLLALGQYDNVDVITIANFLGKRKL